MEIKYCERCGAFLGMVAVNRKYCLNCYSIANLERCRERSRKRNEARRKEAAKPVPCAWCGKPLVRRNTCQKYHAECQKAAYAALQKKLRKKYRESGKSSQYKKPERKKEKPKKKNYTIEEIEAKAKELGITYGKVVLGLQLGTIDGW